MTERPISADDEHTACAACGEPVSYTDEGGCVGTHPNAYHMRAQCLLEAYRRAHAEGDALREALREVRLLGEQWKRSGDSATRIVIERRAYTENVAAQEAAYWYCRKHGIHASDLDIGQILQVAGPIILQGAVEALSRMPERPIERDWSVHPGEILREALDERDMTQTDLAALLGISQPAVNHIVTGERGIGAATALKLEDALGISARFWLHLQADHDLYIARERAADAR